MFAPKRNTVRRKKRNVRSSIVFALPDSRWSFYGTRVRFYHRNRSLTNRTRIRPTRRTRRTRRPRRIRHEMKLVTASVRITYHHPWPCFHRRTYAPRECSGTIEILCKWRNVRIVVITVRTVATGGDPTNCSLAADRQILSAIEISRNKIIESFSDVIDASTNEPYCLRS